MQTDHLWCKLRCSNLCRWYPMQSSASVTIPKQNFFSRVYISLVRLIGLISCSSNFCPWIFVRLNFFSSISVSHGTIRFPIVSWKQNFPRQWHFANLGGIGIWGYNTEKKSTPINWASLRKPKEKYFCIYMCLSQKKRNFTIRHLVMPVKRHWRSYFDLNSANNNIMILSTPYIFKKA